ncbi:hypothetical protein [Microscilla marina]|uniref:Uncharacterized protein n=1 Tax=Microscilla marina ATCC 23134 TaxID=313606 RepID=A1ZK04_MICM2|nr:hypothetical protein [Microscilla marina]EAY29457.1 hypothetical protein M23134_01517 [Microscilla marina ATCC 23134]
MKNNLYNLRSSQKLIKDLNQAEIHVLGKQLYESIPEEGASDITIRFLAECFVYQKEHHLPKPLLQYLKDNPAEFERVIACTQALGNPQSTTLQIPTYARIAAVVLFAVGLFFLWQLYFKGTSNKSPQNTITHKKVDSTQTDTLKKPLITNEQKEKYHTDSAKLMPSNPHVAQKEIVSKSQKEQSAIFDKYIAMKSRFEDIGVRLQYNGKAVRSKSANSKKRIIPVTIQAPSMVSWHPVKEPVQFTVKAATLLPDTAQMFIQIENYEREPVKLIPLKKVAPQQWQCTWLTTQLGLYYWQFKRYKTHDPQPTGKIYVGDKALIKRLYVRFPGLGGS